MKQVLASICLVLMISPTGALAIGGNVRQQQEMFQNGNTETPRQASDIHWGRPWNHPDTDGPDWADYYALAGHFDKIRKLMAISSPTRRNPFIRIWENVPLAERVNYCTPNSCDPDFYFIAEHWDDQVGVLDRVWEIWIPQDRGVRGAIDAIIWFYQITERGLTPEQSEQSWAKSERAFFFERWANMVDEDN